MRRLLLLFFIITGTLSAQYTTSVNGHAQDSTGQNYSNGSYIIRFNPEGNTGAFKLPDGSIFVPPDPITGALDSSGNFLGVAVTSNTNIRPTNTKWTFQFCPLATTTCQSVDVIITGVTQTVSQVFPPIQVQANTNVLAQAYSDSEISSPLIGTSYFNIISQTIRVCTGTALPCIWAAAGSSGSGTINPGTQYLIPTYPNAGSTIYLGPTNISTDATLNNINIPGTAQIGSPADNAQLTGTLQPSANCAAPGTSFGRIFFSSTTNLPMWSANTGACVPISVNGSTPSYVGLDLTGLPDGCLDIATFVIGSTGSPCGAGATTVDIKTNGTDNLSQVLLNLKNSAATNGITLTVTNTSGGDVQLGLSGTLDPGGLTNSSTTVGGSTCTLGGTCTPSVSVGGVTCTTGSTCFPSDTTITVGTGAIGANTCTTNATATMTGLTTAMTLSFTPTTSTTGVTGWGSTGGLVITAYPTSNTLNYSVCNQTGASITPSGSVTFNVSAR